MQNEALKKCLCRQVAMARQARCLSCRHSVGYLRSRAYRIGQRKGLKKVAVSNAIKGKNKLGIARFIVAWETVPDRNAAALR